MSARERDIPDGAVLTLGPCGAPMSIGGTDIPPGTGAICDRKDGRWVVRQELAVGRAARIAADLRELADEMTAHMRPPPFVVSAAQAERLSELLKSAAKEPGGLIPVDEVSGVEITRKYFAAREVDRRISLLREAAEALEKSNDAV